MENTTAIQDGSQNEPMLKDVSKSSEVFMMHDPPEFSGTRTVLPPLADAEGTFWISELMDWFDLMDQVYSHNSSACWFFESQLAAMKQQDADRAKGCIQQITRILPTFKRRDPDLIHEQ
jgi:hypothetical protein